MIYPLVAPATRFPHSAFCVYPAVYHILPEIIATKISAPYPSQSDGAHHQPTATAIHRIYIASSVFLSLISHLHSASFAGPAVNPSGALREKHNLLPCRYQIASSNSDNIKVQFGLPASQKRLRKKTSYIMIMYFHVKKFSLIIIYQQCEKIGFTKKLFTCIIAHSLIFWQPSRNKIPRIHRNLFVFCA